MFQDARHHLVCQLEGPPARRAVNTWLRAGAHRFQKCSQLGAERFLRLGGQLLEVKLRLAAVGHGGGHTDPQGVAARVVHRDVLVLLEETHLAHALGGDAAGRYVGHCA